MYGRDEVQQGLRRVPVSNVAPRVQKRVSVSCAPGFAWSEAQAAARRLSASRDPLKLLSGCVGASDFAMVFSLLLMVFGRNNLSAQLVTSAALISLITINVLSLSHAYGRHIKDTLITQVVRAGFAWTLVFAVVMMIVCLTSTFDEYPRNHLLYSYLAVISGLALVRCVAALQFWAWRQRGCLARTIAVVDLVGCGAAFARQMAGRPGEDIHLLGVFVPNDNADQRSKVADLMALSHLFRIDEILVLLDGRQSARDATTLSAVLRELQTIPTSIGLCPALPNLQDSTIHTALIRGIPTLTLNRCPLGTWGSVIKRSEDLIISCIALLLMSPVMLLVAIAIKLDSPGPVLFRQVRHGFNGNNINVFKFRTMKHRPSGEAQVMQATRDDPRVTRVGRVLRRTSLDELPQILNVLRGEMALVGPRPHVIAQNQQYGALIEGYLGRHRMQPGITGWAQINGFRGETETIDKMRKRVEYDLAYIDNWSIILDLRIIALTVISVLFDRQAY